MEVHHHPNLHPKKKKLREYFLECIMIFLAVTLGFFAETIRENISEKHRERDYIAGLINNLQTDTANLNGLIARNDRSLKGMDSLLNISKNNFADISVQDSIFYYAIDYTFDLHLFQFSDLTLVQLRNAGGYSLIKSSHVADSIALYESKNNSIKIQERFFTDSYLQTISVFKQVFDGTILERFSQSFRKTNRIPADLTVLISKDPEKMHLLCNNYWMTSLILKSYNGMLPEHLVYLKGFLLFLKQKYDME